MRVWRICTRKRQDTAFSGDGGLYAASRWLPKGHRAVYVAESLALASLEMFVHLETNEIPLVAFQASLLDNISIEQVDPTSIDPEWGEVSAFPTLQKFGVQWHLSKRTPVLKVPSAIIPVEYNYILNPEHPEFVYTVEPPLEFRYDQRMWKRIVSS
jgi:RES domain-containing protein